MQALRRVRRTLLSEPTAVVDAAALAQTVAAIRAVQTSSGCIPHTPGAQADPWNHIEAAMALDAGGRHEDAARAYRWLASVQRGDGAWEAGLRHHRVVDPTLDANFTAYVATGVWHHYLATGDDTFVAEMWSVVERAVDFTLDLQTPTGVVMWARDAHYAPWPGALLTSSSCIFLSLRCAIAIAEMVETIARIGSCRWSSSAGDCDGTRFVRAQETLLDGLVLPGAVGSRSGRRRHAAPR